MIERYFLIVTKDKEGFTIPYTEKGKAPELFLDAKAAKSKLQFIKNCYQSKIDYVPAEEGTLKKFFRKTEQLAVSEEQKKEMRWFITHASVQGALIKL